MLSFDSTRALLLCSVLIASAGITACDAFTYECDFGDYDAAEYSYEDYGWMEPTDLEVAQPQLTGTYASFSQQQMIAGTADAQFFGGDNYLTMTLEAVGTTEAMLVLDMTGDFSALKPGAVLHFTYWDDYNDGLGVWATGCANLDEYGGYRMDDPADDIVITVDAVADDPDAILVNVATTLTESTGDGRTKSLTGSFVVDRDALTR